jgi:cytochrome c
MTEESLRVRIRGSAQNDAPLAPAHRGICSVSARTLAVLIAALVAVSAAAADTMSRGERLFRANCIGCHSFGCNRSGPKLQDVFGRSAGSLPDFGSYSESLRRSGIFWSEETLNEFLADPGKRVPGTWMSIVSIKNPEDRREIIAFVKQQDRSLDLCS